LASQDHDIPAVGHDLFGAAFRNYLREDITAALIQNRPLQINIALIRLDSVLESDDSWANQISYILGRVVNRCLGPEATALNLAEWTKLMDVVDAWKKNLPTSFVVLSPVGTTESSFGRLWFLKGWHIAGIMYHHVAVTILLLARPVPIELTTRQRIEEIRGLHQQLEQHAMQICAMAISNNNKAMRVNAFGPIAFCGIWLRSDSQRNELVRELWQWTNTIAWPVEHLVRSLEAAWESSPAVD